MPALLLLILWPIAEAIVALKIAQTIGVLVTVLLLLAGWPLGLWLVRAEGRTAWRRLSQSALDGRAPGADVLDRVLVLAGAALLIVPGFITDALALCLLLPPVRALARRTIVHRLQSRLLDVTGRFARRPGASTAYDVDSTASATDPPRLRRR